MFEEHINKKQIVQELQRYNIDLAAIQETKQNGKFISEIDNYILFNSGVDNRELETGFMVKKSLKGAVITFKPISERMSYIRLRNHILVERRDAQLITRLRSYMGAEANSDHFLVRADLKQEIPKKKEGKKTQRDINVNKLKKAEVQQEYEQKMNERIRSTEQDIPIEGREAKRMGLAINQEKTKFMKMETKQTPAKPLKVTTEEGTTYEFEEVNRFKYLGVVITNKNEMNEEIEERIAKANKSVGRLNRFLRNKPNKYTKFDYCTLNCDEDVHSACKCAITPPREEMRYIPFVEFRTKVLAEHNKWRDYIASGKETRPNEGWSPAAGNMMVMSYDLELEYITRCRGVTSYRHSAKDLTGHDKCRVRIGHLSVGQNLYGTSRNDTNKIITRGIQNWYDEVALIKNEKYVDKYIGQHGTGHLTQLVWWSANRLGCSMVYSPESLASWKHTLICNYASFVTPRLAGNVLEQPVYQRTETPCDSCPNATKCGDTPEYPSLCGKQEPIPTDAPGLIRRLGENRGETNKKGSKIVVYIPIIVFYLVY
ncbi:hypothetical protein Zmor_013016 [Zophobas morio]|uniref:SCP domain-containing protein n=1 Tax=Zophobas morio TaxID=2755281 RepID=A0AA38MEV1_9CUCU|nr:hypothetical protein Zmor_013016 [Zophobas morio]